MADKEVAVKIRVETDGGKSLSELKQEFKDTQKTLEGLTKGTKDYITTLNNLGAIKDDIGDLNDTIKTFNPEGKIQAFGNVMGGVASGIQGAVGAMALFGIESEETQKMLLKVQAASAFAEGIKGVIGLGDAFNNLKLVLGKTVIGQKLVTAAQWLWNAAMDANPIGLIILAIGALVSAFALLSTSSEDAAAKQVRLNELEKEALAQREKDIALIRRRMSLLDESANYELNLAKSYGRSSEELYKIEHDNIQKRIDDINLLKWYRVKGELSADELLELNKLNREKSLLEVKYKTETINNIAAKEKKAGEDKKVIDDKELQESKARAAEARKDLEELHNVRKGFAQLEEQDRLEKQAKADADVEAETQKILSRLASRNELIQFQNAQTYTGQLENLQIQMDAELALVEGNEAAKELIRIKYAEKNREINIQEVNANLEIAQQSNDAMQGLSDLYFSVKMANLQKGSAAELKAAKEQFKVNKALAITTGIISTIQGVINALTAQSSLPEPYATILKVVSAVSVAAAGAANVAKISAQQFNPGGGGGGGSMASLGSAGGGVALAPPSSGSTSLNADGTIKAAMGNNQPTVKAVVVETDITKSQKRVNTIEERASL